MFAIYLPGRTGANPEHLRAVGLGDLLSPDDASPDFTDLIPGPDNAAGIAAHWGGAVTAGAFEWTKSPRGEFWFGRPKQGDRLQVTGDSRQKPSASSPAVTCPLSPVTFLRRRQLRGIPVTLADGQAWTIASAQQLPCVLGLDAEGQWTGKTDPTYQAYYDACWGFWESLEVGNATVSWAKGADFAALALSINYRVNRDVAAWQGLLRDDVLWDVAKAAVEFDRFQAILQKKTAAAAGSGEPPIGDSPSTVPGGSA